MPEPESDPAGSLPELIGRTIAGKYEVIRIIGRGGMGTVFEAEHKELGRKVAIKFIRGDHAKDERVTSRFAREARAASSIDSAHIVSCVDAGAEDGLPYIVMELLEGEDLGSRLRRDVRLPLEESLHIAAQLLRGLARAHDAGIVHRDLKPDNVFLVERDGDTSFVKVVDFGISKIQRASSATIPLALTGQGTVLGTPFYMAPEQAQADPDVDARADLYSVGAILFECLAGRPPHVGEYYEQVILAICMKDAPDLRAIVPATPAPVSKLVSRALERDRTRRFRSARQMLAAIHEIAPREKALVPVDPPEDGAEAEAEDAPSAPDVTPAAEAVAADEALGVAGREIRDDAAVRPAPPMDRRRAAALGSLAALLGLAVTWAIVHYTYQRPVAPPLPVASARPFAPVVAPPPSAPTATASAGPATPPPPVRPVATTAPSSPRGLGSGLELIRTPP